MILICNSTFAGEWSAYTLRPDQLPAASVQPNRDDPQPDTLSYDDGNGHRVYPHQLFSCNWFTAPEEFELRSIYFHPCNHRNNQNLGCNVYIYTAGQNGLPVERLWTTWIDPPLRHGWNSVDLPEEDYITFEAGDHFNIIYGPSSGDAFPGGQGDGWWNFLDEATNSNRSFISDNLQNRWTLIGGDLLIRAGGEIGGELLDLGVDAVANEIEKFFLTGIEPISYNATITNYGEVDVEEFSVTFSALIVGENDPVWTNTVECGNLAVDESVSVETEEAFEAFGGLGYHIIAEVITDGDDNPDNDDNSLEQIIDFPADVGENEGTWFGYTDGHTDGGLQFDGGVFGVMFYPPDDQPTRVTRIRGSVEPQNWNDVEFRIYIYDGETYDLRWSGMVAPLMDQWMEVDVSDEENLTAFPGESILVAYEYSERIMMRFDRDHPIAGSNPLMPATMFQSIDDGESWEAQGMGDYGLEVRLAYTDEIPPRGILEHSPAAIDFGNAVDIEIGIPIERQLALHNTGNATVSIDDINIGEEFTDEFSFSDTEFDILQADSFIVTLTWTPEDLDLLETEITISNDSENETYTIPVIGNNLGIDGNTSNAPTEFGLSTAYPNPFNSSTQLSFSLPFTSETMLTVYDINGAEITQLVKGEFQTGSYDITWNANNVSSGVYYIRLEAGIFIDTEKVVLIR